jgi:hypothetical protein
MEDGTGCPPTSKKPFIEIQDKEFPSAWGTPQPDVRQFVKKRHFEAQIEVS